MSCTQSVATCSELAGANASLIKIKYPARNRQRIHEFGLRIPRKFSAEKGFVDGRFGFWSAKVSGPLGINTSDAERNIGSFARMDGLYNAKSDQIGICMYQSDLTTLALYTAAAVDEDRRTGHTSASEVSKEA